MGTTENPDLEISWYDEANEVWVEVTSYCKSFKVDDWGLSKVPKCSLQLWNYLDIPLYALMRIYVNTRGVDDLIFIGRVYDLTEKLIGGTNLFSVEVELRGLLQRLVSDTITKNFYDEQKAAYPNTLWSYKDMLDRESADDSKKGLLVLPDSGYDTGFRVDDGGSSVSPELYMAVDGAFNFERQKLLEALRMVCETVGYDGYVYPGETNIMIFLRKIGTVNADPAVTLDPPFLKFERLRSLEDLANYVFVWGGIEKSLPPDGDRFTEQAMDKYSGLWTAVTDYTVIEDEIANIFGEHQKGHYCLRIARTINCYESKIVFDPSVLGYSSLDLKNRFRTISFLLKVTSGSTVRCLRILLEDVNGKVVFFVFSKEDQDPYTGHKMWKLKLNEVYFVDAPTGIDPKPYLGNRGVYGGRVGEWTYGENVDSFDWSQVKKIYLELKTLYDYNAHEWYIDGFQFIGAFEIHPFKHPDLIPPAYDQSSIDTYGLHVMHVNDRSIISFEQAQAEANRVLENLKNPVPTLKITDQTAYPWVKPHECVTVNIPQLNINNETWRIIHVTHEWKSNQPLKTTLELVPQTAKTPPLWTKHPELLPLIK